MVLTEKEMATIEDLHTQELSCVEKYKRYGQEAKDPVLRDLFADLEKKEQKHVESLEQVMKGSVPSCNVNDRDGKMYEPKATYDSMTNPELRFFTEIWNYIIITKRIWTIAKIATKCH